jgi:hypothetical protein
MQSNLEHNVHAVLVKDRLEHSAHCDILRAVPVSIGASPVSAE